MPSRLIDFGPKVGLSLTEEQAAKIDRIYVSEDKGEFRLHLTGEGTKVWHSVPGHFPKDEAEYLRKRCQRLVNRIRARRAA